MTSTVEPQEAPETHEPLEEITEGEIVHLHDALVSAFRTVDALELMVKTHLGSQFPIYATPADRADVHAYVDTLVHSMRSRGSIAQLLRAARNHNPDSLCLRAFAERYWASREARVLNELPIGLVRRIVSALLCLPTIDDYNARTTLLIGVPASVIPRSATNAMTDLKLIVSALGRLGPSISGEVPLRTVLENACLGVEAFPVGGELQALAREVALHYRA
jgi:hypothetical protein